VELVKPQSQAQLDLQQLTQLLDLQRLCINSQVLERSQLAQQELLKFLLWLAAVEAAIFLLIQAAVVVAA
jgi:hypothetical protein